MWPEENRVEQQQQLLHGKFWFVCTFIFVLVHSTTAVQSRDEVAIDYCLELHAGANLISFHALPADASISNVMASLLGNVTSVIGESVAASYTDGTGWIGSLTTISPLSGYWVEVNESASLCLSEAIPNDPAAVYELRAGNNLVSFPFNGSVNVVDALPNDVENVITKIIGESVAASNIAGDGWVGSLTAFEGGKGYWITATAPVDLVFQTFPPGDYDRDFTVALTDLNLVLFNWNSDPPAGEWTSNIPTGIVGLTKLNEVLFNWGASPAALATVPEPATLPLLMTAPLLIMTRRGLLPYPRK